MKVLTIIGILLCANQVSCQLIRQLDLVTIPKKVNHLCPSVEERQSRFAVIRENVLSAIMTRKPQCGNGSWHRVAFLNMSSSSEQCPSNWREYNSSGVRACGRTADTVNGCKGTFFNAGRQYDQVCGRAIGYQFLSPDAFASYRYYRRTETLNEAYVDGVSITHGFPSRMHIWTMAAGITEGTQAFPRADCPCVARGQAPPAFVGKNYYCESGNPNSEFGNRLYTNDPLWDGNNCEGNCCSVRSDGRSPPWFSVQLPTRTSDAIEVRICGDQSTVSDEDTLIALLELYVQ